MSDDHGHEHPKHELSYYAKRIYAIRDLLLDVDVRSLHNRHDGDERGYAHHQAHDRQRGPQFVRPQ